MELGVNLGSWLIPEHDYAVVTNESLCKYTERVGAAKSSRVMEELWTASLHTCKL